MSELFYLEINGIPKEDIHLLPKDALIQREEKEKIGYSIGQDWAYYHQPLPDNADAAIYRGYKSNTAHPPGRKEVDRFIKKWLQLRYHAYLRERTVSETVTPKLIEAMDMTYCRVTEQDLTHSTQNPTDWSVERLCNNAGYAWGNLVIISRQANEARGAMTYEDICQASLSGRATNGLTKGDWLRYKDLVRGPYFWAGQVKGIEPICMPIAKLAFSAPSQLLQNLVFFAICHRSLAQRESTKKLLKSLCPTESSKIKLKKVFTRISRHRDKRHSLLHMFSNLSCMKEFMDWYESSNFDLKKYEDLCNESKNGYLNLPKNTPNQESPLDEWWLGTDGHLY